MVGRTPRLRVWAAYLATLVVAAVVLWLVRERGSSLIAPPAPIVHAAHGARAGPHLLAHVLLALAVITLSARAVGALFQRFLGQPAVMGEIVAGLLLGPSVLGALVPFAYTFLLPPAIAPHLGMVAQIGVVLFMFLVGLELDGKLLRKNSHASIVVPLVLGSVLALSLYPRYSQQGVDFTVFALFIGVSLAVTAFPVLARILTDRRMQSTSLGVTALACAAVDDATAWCLLALVSGLARARLGEAWWTLLMTGAYGGFMLAVVRPMLARLSARFDRRGASTSLGVLALVFAGVLLSAFVTESIGIHALFGAFLFGAVAPHDGRLAAELRSRLEDIVVVLLLPVFFTFSGMRTQIGLVSTMTDWLYCGAIVLVATLGKFGGSFVAARIAGLGYREASALGVLMNTRGLMELIVLNVGLDMGVLSPTLFAMLVIMALVTTFSTTPVLSLLSWPGMTGSVPPLPLDAYPNVPKRLPER